MQHRPKIVVVDGNTLSLVGMKQLLLHVMPVLTVDTFGSFAELECNNPDQYVHYFVSMDIVLSHRPFFMEHRRKTIVLTMSLSDMTQLHDFHALNVNQPERQLVHDLLMLEQHAHAHGHNLPEMPRVLSQKILTDREIEVMSLIVQGYINKEIADRLHVALSTVVTHRKNIMDKLGMKSVSALTIYAVMHGYVNISKI